MFAHTALAAGDSSVKKERPEDGAGGEHKVSMQPSLGKVDAFFLLQELKKARDQHASFSSETRRKSKFHQPVNGIAEWVVSTNKHRGGHMGDLLCATPANDGSSMSRVFNSFSDNGTATSLFASSIQTSITKQDCVQLAQQVV